MTDLPPPVPPEPKTAPTPVRGGKGVRIALAVSVALNLAFVGMAAGLALRGGPHERMVRDLDFGPYGEAFSREDRKALRDGFFARSGNLRDMRDEMRSDMVALLAVLRAEPLDRAALQGLLDRQNARLSERLELGRTLVAERIAAMGPADRAAFADRLEKALRHGGRRGD
ncbi:MAG: hypothetical protein RIR62_1585 [Pseudomonadota bacterium]|jgi:uncharacterized membrane protein